MEDSDAEASLLMTLDGNAPKNKRGGTGIGRNRRMKGRGWHNEKYNLA